MTIAGSDPGGGAGLQADLKTFAALGVYGYSVITEVIAQNSWKVANVDAMSPEMVEAQLDILAMESAPRAVKTGALANVDDRQGGGARDRTAQVAGARGRSRDRVEQRRAAARAERGTRDSKAV